MFVASVSCVQVSSLKSTIHSGFYPLSLGFLLLEAKLSILGWSRSDGVRRTGRSSAVLCRNYGRLLVSKHTPPANDVTPLDTVTHKQTRQHVALQYVTVSRKRYCSESVYISMRPVSCVSGGKPVTKACIQPKVCTLCSKQILWLMLPYSWPQFAQTTEVLSSSESIFDRTPIACVYMCVRACALARLAWSSRQSRTRLVMFSIKLSTEFSIALMCEEWHRNRNCSWQYTLPHGLAEAAICSWDTAKHTDVVFRTSQ